MQIESGQALQMIDQYLYQKIVLLYNDCIIPSQEDKVYFDLFW